MHDQPARVEPLVIGPTVGKYTYTNEAKLTKLGPHRFMIPANYFTDQMGPDFQGSVGLELLWPKWEPLPPGRRREMSMNEFNRQARASYAYSNTRPVQVFLERMSNNTYLQDDSILKQDPVDNLAYRTRGEDVYGLERWYVSEADKTRYLRLIEGQRDRYAWPKNPEYIDDMYIHRNEAGHPLTYIRCSSPILPDGLIIQGDALVKDDNPRVAQCTHYFVLPQYDVRVDVNYPRVLLRDWVKIQARFTELLTQFYIGTEDE